MAKRGVPASLEGVLDSALDKAIAIQRPIVQGYVYRLRQSHADASPAQIIEMLERRYLAAVIGIGGASGAAAVLPGTGTAVSVASGAAEITAFVSATAMYVLALAELHSVPVSDPEVRRALVVATLLGEGGTAALELAEGETRHWARSLGKTLTRDRMTGLNARLAHLFVTRFGARQGALLFGRALPLGIGASVGAIGNAALARGAISAARKAFGPAPATFPPRVIDG